VGAETAGGIGLGLFAIVLGVGGIVAAIRVRRRRAEIAPTYGATGGMIYTVVQAGCSGLLVLGGIGIAVAAILASR
jgi:hypothetical protein